MSEKERAVALLSLVPDYKMGYVLAYLEGLTADEGAPNAETLEAFEELDSGGGHKFSGSTAQLFAELLEG